MQVLEDVEAGFLGPPEILSETWSIIGFPGDISNF